MVVKYQTAFVDGMGFAYRSTTCRACGRALKNTRSMIAGIGPICEKRERKEREASTMTNTDRADLVFDPVTLDIRCERRDDGLHFNIPHWFVHHSPSGFEWGYEGSGPADFALNILAIFIGPPPPAVPAPDEDADDDEWSAWIDYTAQRVALWDGSIVHCDVWQLHQPFKNEFVAKLPREGGIIEGSRIIEWLGEHGVTIDHAGRVQGEAGSSRSESAENG